MASRHMNQSSARIRSRCFGNSHCWAGASLFRYHPHGSGHWWQSWNFAGWAYQVSTCSSIKWLWKNGLPTLNANDLVSDRGAHSFSTPSQLVKITREHRGKVFQSFEVYRNPARGWHPEEHSFPCTEGPSNCKDVRRQVRPFLAPVDRVSAFLIFKGPTSEFQSPFRFL